MRRDDEIEQPSNRWIIHPLSRLCVRAFVRAGVSANTVSLLGMAGGALAGVAYAHGAAPGWCVAGFTLMGFWHVMDGADGQLARLTGTQSALGRVLDGVCDYSTFVAVYVGLCVAQAPLHGAWVWLLASLAGASHAVQAAGYEAQRQDFIAWGIGRGVATGMDGAGRPAGRLGLLHGVYAALQRLVTGAADGLRGRVQRALSVQAGGAEAAMLEQRRRLYRRMFATVVLRWSLLSANQRTLAIFLCAVAGHPLWYFGLELLAGNALLAVLLVRQPGRLRAFLAACGA